MRRWNGWGDDRTNYPLPDSAASYLAGQIGEGQEISDITLDQALKLIPASRLPVQPFVQTDPIVRLRHAVGQSFPDWVANHSGQIAAFPDGVAYPGCEQDVRSSLEYARQTGTKIIPYGGGTSVVGHINPLPGEAPVLTIDLSRLNKLVALDENSRLATFEAGVAGPHLEEQLNGRGYTLGHFPQSFELSTLGGWIATRSSGQQSYYYGRIEDLFAGGHLETPAGSLDFLPLPASAAGPDLRQFILGSEGRLGILTQATVRIRPLPEVEAFYGIFFHEWESGVKAVQEIAQSGVPVSMARLSNPLETETNLRLSGKDSLVTWANRGLGLLNYGAQRCLMILGVTGDPQTTRFARQQALTIARRQGGLFTGASIGKIWQRSRFLTPYLRNTLWEHGYAADTLETALPWSKVIVAAQEILDSLHRSISPIGEKVLAFAHLSHIYVDGASIYVTYIFRRSVDPGETLHRWKAMKSAASQVIITNGGTISHQHGVGLDHAPYLEAEKGPLGIDLLQSTARVLDPEGSLNPGKLWQ